MNERDLVISKGIRLSEARNAFYLKEQLLGTCADPESFVRGGTNLITFFFSLYEPSLARQRKAFRWWADDGPTLNTGFVAL